MALFVLPSGEDFLPARPGYSMVKMMEMLKVMEMLMVAKMMEMAEMVMEVKYKKV